MSHDPKSTRTHQMQCIRDVTAWEEDEDDAPTQPSPGTWVRTSTELMGGSALTSFSEAETVEVCPREIKERAT